MPEKSNLDLIVPGIVVLFFIAVFQGSLMVAGFAGAFWIHFFWSAIHYWYLYLGGLILMVITAVLAFIQTGLNNGGW